MNTNTSRDGSVAVQVVVGVLSVGAIVLGIAAIQSSRAAIRDSNDLKLRLETQAAATSQIENDLQQVKLQSRSDYALLSQDVVALKDQLTKKPVPVPAKAVTTGGKQPAAATTDAPTGPGTVHVVKSGDILGKIAKQYGTTSAAIAALNPNLDEKRLKIGQKIRVK